MLVYRGVQDYSASVFAFKAQPNVDWKNEVIKGKAQSEAIALQ